MEWNKLDMQVTETFPCSKVEMQIILQPEPY